MVCALSVSRDEADRRSLLSALFMAPAWKWGLSIVPLIGLVKGYPKPEDLDLNQSVGACVRGCRGCARCSTDTLVCCSARVHWRCVVLLRLPCQANVSCLVALPSGLTAVVCRAYLLVAVNMAMLLVHGNNVRRKLEYNESKKPKAIEGPKSA